MATGLPWNEVAVQASLHGARQFVHAKEPVICSFAPTMFPHSKRRMIAGISYQWGQTVLQGASRHHWQALASSCRASSCESSIALAEGMILPSSVLFTSVISP